MNLKVVYLQGNFVLRHVNLFHIEFLNIQSCFHSKFSKQFGMILWLDILNRWVLYDFGTWAAEDSIAVSNKYCQDDHRIDTHYLDIRSAHDGVNQSNRHNNEKVSHVL